MKSPLSARSLIGTVVHRCGSVKSDRIMREKPWQTARQSGARSIYAFRRIRRADARRQICDWSRPMRRAIIVALAKLASSPDVVNDP